MFPGHFCQPSKLQARLVKRPELVPSSCAHVVCRGWLQSPQAVAGPWASYFPSLGLKFSFCEMGGHEIQLLWRSTEIHLKISIPQLTKLNLNSSKIYKKKPGRKLSNVNNVDLWPGKTSILCLFLVIVTLGKKFRILGLQFPCLQNGDDKSNCLISLFCK